MSALSSEICSEKIKMSWAVAADLSALSQVRIFWGVVDRELYERKWLQSESQEPKFSLQVGCMLAISIITNQTEMLLKDTGKKLQKDIRYFVCLLDLKRSLHVGSKIISEFIYLLTSKIKCVGIMS